MTGRVALKVLKPELATVVGAERFVAEIKTTANLFYVMPYVEGDTLRECIDREKQLPVDDALHIAGAMTWWLWASPRVRTSVSATPPDSSRFPTACS